MPQARRLDELKILESSGVDRPANQADGWLVMKNATSGLVLGNSSTAAMSFTVPPGMSVTSSPVFFTATGAGSGGTLPPVKTTKADKGPHSFKASADAPAVCATCGETKGAGMHYRFGQKALDGLAEAFRQQQSPTMTEAQTKAADAVLVALTALRKEGGMPPDLDSLDPDVKAHIADLQAKVDAAAAAGGTPPPVETPPATTPPPATPPVETPPPAEVAPDMVAMQKALADEKTARAAEVAKAAELAERVAKMERKEREAEFIAKARDLPNVGGAEGLGQMLLTINETAPEATYKELERVLKAANAQLEKGALFAQVGSPGAEAVGPLEEINKLAAAKVAGGTATTVEVAKVAVLKERPDLRDQYYAAQRSSR